MEIVSIKLGKDDVKEGGQIKGYAAVWGKVTHSYSFLEKGAFTKTLAESEKPKFLWQHEWKSIIGKTTSIKEDSKGLPVAGQLFINEPSLPLADQAYFLAKTGELNGISIGFDIVEAVDKKNKDGNWILNIMEAKLMEWSLVTFPASERARATEINSLKNLTDWERALDIIESSFKMHGLPDMADGVVAGLSRRFNDLAESLQTLEEPIPSLDISALIEPLLMREDATTIKEVNETLQDLLLN